MAGPKITLAPVEPNDYHTIACIETAAFEKEEFGVVAFGPYRLSDAAIERRAKGLAVGPKPGETIRNMKAVITLEDGKEEIVGFANWSFYVGRKGSEEEKKKLGNRQAWVVEEAEKDKEGNGWPPGSNLRFCEDSFVRGDELMAKSTGGNDCAKLSVLVVSPKYQRRGIGALLLEDGLREADEKGLQAILGASKNGLGLYLKHAFTVFEVIELKLCEYDRGEGMGIDRHVIMHRRAKSVGKVES